MENINEKFHLPDPKNTNTLIDNIIEEVYKIIISNVLEKKEISSSPIIQGFWLERNINPCMWLGTDNLVICEIYINGLNSDNEKIKPSAKFSEYPKGAGRIDLGDESVGIPMSIHNGMFLLRFNIDSNFRVEQKETINLLKASLMHEIDHAYKEMHIHQIFKIDDSGSDTSDRDFNDAYDELYNILFTDKKSISPEEKNFLISLYHLNYVERSAFTSSFYQRLLNDVNDGKPLLSKEKYHEYDAFLRDRTFIENFNNKSIFDKYVSIVKGLFGEGTKDMKAYMYKAKHSDDSGIRLMDKYYDMFLENKTVLKEHISVDAAHSIYCEQKTDSVKRIYEGIDPDDNMLVEILSKHYTFTDQDSMIASVNKMFSNESFSEKYKHLPYGSFLVGKEYFIN